MISATNRLVTIALLGLSSCQQPGPNSNDSDGTPVDNISDIPYSVDLTEDQVFGAIDLTTDPGLVVGEDTLFGIVEDPDSFDGFYDLTMTNSSGAGAWTRNESPLKIEIRVGFEPCGSCSGNAAHLLMTLNAIGEWSVEASLIQGTDSALYRPCEQSDFGFGYCRRHLAAISGEVILMGEGIEVTAGSTMSGSFEFQTAAGDVSGTFFHVALDVSQYPYSAD